MSVNRVAIESIEQLAASVHTIDSFGRSFVGELLSSAANSASEDDIVIPATITISPREGKGGATAFRCVAVQVCWESPDLQQSVCRSVFICR